jgi:hypothetical protein
MVSSSPSPNMLVNTNDSVNAPVRLLMIPFIARAFSRGAVAVLRLPRTEQIKIERPRVVSDLVLDERMQLVQQARDESTIVPWMIRIPDVLQLAWIVDEVIERDITRRVQ